MGGSNLFLGPLVQRASARPDGLFGLFHDGAEWHARTNAETMNRALRFVAMLRARRLPAGSTVMLVVRHGHDAHACFIGAMLAGCIPSFLPCPSAKQDHSLYWAQHRVVIACNRPPLVLTEHDLLADMRHCVEGDTSEVADVRELDRLEPAALGDDLPENNAIGLLQHSSGTTGMKKGVMLSYGSIARQLSSYTDALGIDAATARIVSWLPLYHDMGLISSFLLPAWLGVPIISIDPFVWVGKPGLFLDAIEAHGATHGWMPNFAFLHMARRVPRAQQWKLGGLKSLISCSEPCKPSAFDAFLDRFGASGIRPEMLQTCYAMAETVFAVSQSDPTRTVRRLAVDPACIAGMGEIRAPIENTEPLWLLSNGRTIDDCDVTVRREDQPVGQRQIGEICVSARYMFSGYHNNPAATEAALNGPWYRTGDIGFVDSDELFVVGRLKDVVIINGKNIFAHDVEAAVSRVAGVKPGRCVAFGRYSEKSGSELLVVVAERDGDRDIDIERLMQRDINRAVVDETGVPCADIRIVAAGWLVKTTSGKTSRSENAGKYARDFIDASPG